MPTVPPFIDFTEAPKLAEARAWAEARPDGAGFAALLRATEQKQIALTAIISRKIVWTPRSLTSPLPNIVLVADDFGDSRNPDEWRCSISAIAWAKSAIVHGTGPQEWHYQAAIRAAKRMERCLLIETDSAHAAAWAAAITPRGIPTLIFLPPPGTQHPATVAEAAR